MKSKIKAIILDWAGTTVDFGSNAPVAAFILAFEHFGIAPTMEETRAPMGLPKRGHIETMLSDKRLSGLWRERYGRPHTEEDIDAVYAAFEPMLMATLPTYADPLPDVVHTVKELRRADMKIGSTTGYTEAMIQVVAPAARKKGYSPDSLVCPDETGGIGRPYPYMLWRNLEKLQIASFDEVIKVGDTAADMEEGRNAGCLTVGILKGSNMMGLSANEFDNLSAVETAAHYEMARKKYQKAGTDHILDDITALPGFVERINRERRL